YNPHTTIGNPLRPDNKNITIHRPAEPWRGHVLAVHLIRFLSIAMAAVTVLACYTIALSLFKGNRRQAAGAMAITAFNPMFIFISSSVNNDNAVIMFVTLALWLMVYLALNYERLTNKQMLGYAILLGALIGLGALSKLYAFGLLPVAGVLFIWLAYKKASPVAQREFVIRPPVADQPGALASDPHPPISQSPNPQSPIATAIT
ncbi:MAG: phospholipid carrier-dependent glycosyltransferase, partial [Chloroflexi bacterium]|nr:phospholipid carrier-dependent glycosyltransferase [Chloroflexota bacterium]